MENHDFDLKEYLPGSEALYERSYLVPEVSGTPVDLNQGGADGLEETKLADTSNWDFIDIKVSGNSYNLSDANVSVTYEADTYSYREGNSYSFSATNSASSTGSSGSDAAAVYSTYKHYRGIHHGINLEVYAGDKMREAWNEAAYRSDISSQALSKEERQKLETKIQEKVHRLKLQAQDSGHGYDEASLRSQAEVETALDAKYSSTNDVLQWSKNQIEGFVTLLDLNLQSYQYTDSDTYLDPGKMNHYSSGGDAVFGNLKQPISPDQEAKEKFFQAGKVSRIHQRADIANSIGVAPQHQDSAHHLDGWVYDQASALRYDLEATNHNLNMAGAIHSFYAVNKSRVTIGPKFEALWKNLSIKHSSGIKVVFHRPIKIDLKVAVKARAKKLLAEPEIRRFRRRIDDLEFFNNFRDFKRRKSLSMSDWLFYIGNYGYKFSERRKALKKTRLLIAQVKATKIIN